ncbi:MAG: hypothetical protein KGI50_06460 [Patescibacteria group bacterium]|nr:hypothetical protein [Patescibacteria group bacterium]MDE2439183.1 hypothetical protein [Patescibacteria group bacterium]
MELYELILGQPNFETGVSTETKKCHKVKAIALPVELHTLFYKSQFVQTYDEYERQFIILDIKCDPTWIEQGQFLGYKKQRYNIKSSEKYEGIYYYVVATTQGVQQP